MIVNSQVDAKLPHKKENDLNEVSEEVGPCVSYAIISRWKTLPLCERDN